MRFKPAQHYNQPIDSTATVHVVFPAGVLNRPVRAGARLVERESQEIEDRRSIDREDLSYAHLEMDDCCFTAGYAERDGAADLRTGFVIRYDE